MKARLPSLQSSVTLTREDGASVVVPIRVPPLALGQLLTGIYPEPTGTGPDLEEQKSEWNRVIRLARDGYCLTVEGSDTCPSTPLFDWKTATPASLTVYADAIWAEIEEAGFTLPDYRQLMTGIAEANNKTIGEIIRPKG